MFGAPIFGLALDFHGIKRTTRARIAWVVMFVLTFAIWGGSYVFQKSYKRKDTTDQKSDDFDWDLRVLPHWHRFMGAISNNSRKLAHFAGFYRAIQSAGAAIVRRLDELDAPYMSLFASFWILLAGRLIVALPVVILKIKDTVPVEEDLKVSDETIERVIGLGISYDSYDSPGQDQEQYGLSGFPVERR
ncbi:hypothetical protein ABEF95_014035 [Exophiala dermatitidis]